MKVIKTNTDAKRALKIGVDTVANLVKTTLGPSGQNVIIERFRQAPLITNDGYTIVNAIEIEDEVENLGAEYIKEASRLTNKNAGDGTTTSIVLTQALIDRVFEDLEGNLLGNNGMAKRAEINKVKDEIIKELDAMAKPITKKSEIENVASVSAESKELGKLIADIVEKVGPNGSVSVDDSPINETIAEVTEGIEIQRGIVHPGQMTDFGKRRAIYKQAPIVIFDGTINDVQQMVAVIQKAAASGFKALVMVATDWNYDVIEGVVMSKMQGGFPVLCLETPGFGHKGKDETEDLAVAVGAKILNNLTLLSVSDFGKAEQVIASEDSTLFVGGGGKNDVKNKRVELLKEQLNTHSDTEWIERRIAQLTEGMGVVKVGASSIGEREYLKLKIEDAINATRAAIQEGVVPGGGKALKSLAPKFKGTIFENVLTAPYDQIQFNAGGSLDIPPSIVDPVKVVKEAIRNSSSVAGTLITTNGAIAVKKEDDKKDKK